MIDIVNNNTGEVLRTFDLPYFMDGKRHINSWIKVNGYSFIRIEYPRVGSNQNTTIYVEEVEK